MISPYVIRSIGRRAAQRYFLSAEKFTAPEALRIGLVHEVVAAERLNETVVSIAGELLKSGPHAVAAAKRLIVDVADSKLDDALVEETARRIAGIRVSPEGREVPAMDATSNAPPAARAESAPRERLLALDVFRGATVAGMLLVNNPGSWGAIYPPLAHAPWNGWTPTDLIFPFFLFIVGITTHLSLSARRARGDDESAIMRQVLKRGALVTAANWAVVFVDFTIESVYKLVLAVPVVGGALMVAVLLGSDIRTLFAEGVRGHLSKRLIARYALDRNADHPKFGIGLKELWQVKPEKHRKGLVQHSFGWPLDSKTGGGSFLYHFDDNLVAIGFVVRATSESARAPASSLTVSASFCASARITAARCSASAIICSACACAFFRASSAAESARSFSESTRSATAFSAACLTLWPADATTSAKLV